MKCGAKVTMRDCQNEIFDYAGVRNFCYDEDINVIVETLDSLVEKCGFSSVKRWSTYQEVPEMGDCMVYDIRYDQLPDGFMKEIVKCKMKAKREQIDLAIYPDQIYYSDSLKHMVIYSRFLDQERRIRIPVCGEQNIAGCIA